jgi:hypothetical protein
MVVVLPSHNGCVLKGDLPLAHRGLRAGMGPACRATRKGGRS